VMDAPKAGEGAGENPLSPDSSLKVALQRLLQDGSPKAVVENGEVIGQLAEADIRTVAGQRASEVLRQ